MALTVFVIPVRLRFILKYCGLAAMAVSKRETDIFIHNEDGFL